MITADTIAEEQIRELRAADDADAQPSMLRRTCDLALAYALEPDSETRRARARCAAILNARVGR
jgi:hypothetical protein